MARNCSADTVCIRIRLAWNEKSALACLAQQRGQLGLHRHIELGTTSPIRWMTIAGLLPAGESLTSVTNILR